MMGVMADLPMVGRVKVPGEQPSDDASQVVPLTLGELVPEWWDQLDRVRLPTDERGALLRMSVSA